MRVSIFSYHQPTRANLGDAIQTIALERLLTARGHTVTYRDRDSDLGANNDDIHIANGFLMDARKDPPSSLWHGLYWHQSQARYTAFAGIHIPRNSVLEQVIRSNTSKLPIGVRDPWSEALLQAHGIAAKLIGCATLTFEPYRGPREGVYAVDTTAPVPAVCISHHVDNISWEEQLKQAHTLLECYRTAEAVYTNRLHVLLPCLAFGTPVAFSDHAFFEDADRDRRFALARYILRVTPGKLFSTDVNFIARRYEQHLDAILAEAAAR